MKKYLKSFISHFVLTASWVLAFSIAGCSEIKHAQDRRVQSAPAKSSPIKGDVVSGIDRGHGGVGVLCETPVSTRVRLLDFYELERNQGYSIDVLETSIEPMDAVYVALDKLATFNPQLANELRKSAFSFYDDISKVGKHDNLTSDFGEFWISDECGLVQIVVQKEGRYFVAEKFYQLMAPMDRAGLILHEVLYEKALQKGQSNSQNVRKLVGALFSVPSRPLDIHSALKAMGFETSL